MQVQVFAFFFTSFVQFHFHPVVFFNYRYLVVWTAFYLNEKLQN